MRLLSDAWNNLRNHWVLAVIYVGVHAVVITLSQGADAAAALFIHEGQPPAWLPILTLSRSFAASAVISALQAIVFTRLGKSIDRPIWKCHDDREALRRFFVLWFIVNLGLSAIDQVHFNALVSGAEENAMALEIFFFFISILYLPICVCIMHHGRLEWPEIPEALRPMFRQLPLTFTVMLLLLGQYAWYVVTIQAIIPIFPEKAKIIGIVLCIAPMAFIECLAFCAMWRVCMIYRQAGGDDGDDFYDF